jgi:hypothetical protein
LLPFSNLDRTSFSYGGTALAYNMANTVIGGAAYDPGTRTIYLSQQYGNGTDPVIHVFKTP